ncbi:MAG: hypothetical protein ABR575_09295 [Actinomycetota bacterium]
MTGDTLAGVAFQLIAAAVAGWAVSEVGLERLRTSGPGPEALAAPLPLPERALAALAGFVLFACAAMVLHIVSGGAVFGTPWALPALTVLVVLRAAPRRWRFLRPGRGGLVAAGVLALVLGWLYLRPALAGSSIRIGDPGWHLGWTAQVLAGEAVPTGPAADLGRNAYPWGLHAVMAALVRLAPGTDPLVALESLHVVVVAGIPLAAACLARRVRRDAGHFAAAAVALIAGFGWLRAERADLVTSPAEARYGADLVVASPNAVYELFPPALPRELGLVLLGAAALAAMAALRARSRPAAVVAGVATGLVGLVSVPLFGTAVVWTLGATAIAPRGFRRAFAASVLLPAGLVFALWASPVLVDVMRYGGFVGITPVLGKEWALPTSLGAWGLLLPAGLAGASIAARRGVAGRLLVTIAASSALLIGLAIARARFGWDLNGNATLLHQGRMWPGAHLAASALAGVALAGAWAAPRAVVGRVLALSVIATGSLSLWGASTYLRDLVARGDAGFVYGADFLAPEGFVHAAAAHLGPDDTVLVDSAWGDKEISFLLFQLSGARIARYDDPALDGNDLRIRFADLARSWDERARAGGFPAEYVVVPDGPGAPVPRVRVGEAWINGADVLARGTYKERRFALVELVRPVMPAELAR